MEGGARNIGGQLIRYVAYSRERATKQTDHAGTSLSGQPGKAERERAGWRGTEMKKETQSETKRR
eukprot:672600-Pleurochrysis_carterae.AAC.1